MLVCCWRTRLVFGILPGFERVPSLAPSSGAAVVRRKLGRIGGLRIWNLVGILGKLVKKLSTRFGGLMVVEFAAKLLQLLTSAVSMRYKLTF